MFIRKCRDGLCAPILLLFLLVGVAQANAENRAPDLAFVLDQTQRHHPMLARIEAERRRFDPAVALAGQASPLRLSLETENIGDRVSDRLETTLSLAGVLAWSGQPQARADLANTRNQATRLRLAQLRRDVLAEAASRFIRLAGAQAELQQAQRELSLARQTRDATRQRQRAGAASPADLKRASLRTSQAELRKVSAQQALDSARQALQLAMGGVNLPEGEVHAPLAVLPPLPERETLLAQAADSPAVLLSDARLNIARSQLLLAQRGSRPDIEWRVGVRDDRGVDDQSLVAGVSVPLFQSRRNQPAQQVAEAGAEVADHERALARLELKALLLDSWQSLAELRRNAEALGSDLIPASQSVVQALREGYARGRYGLLDLSSAERDLNALIGKRLAAQIQYHQSWIELERLLGRPLSPEDPS